MLLFITWWIILNHSYRTLTTQLITLTQHTARPRAHRPPRGSMNLVPCAPCMPVRIYESRALRAPMSRIYQSHAYYGYVPIMIDGAMRIEPRIILFSDLLRLSPRHVGAGARALSGALDPWLVCCLDFCLRHRLMGLFFSDIYIYVYI
jgi:hypothetical protein